MPGFGFRVSLCKRPYEQGRETGPGLWPALALRGFPHMRIYPALNRLRMLRNRVSHHEPIWDRNLRRDRQAIIRVIGWMNRDLAQTVAAHSPLPETVANGMEGFRPKAEQVIKR